MSYIATNTNIDFKMKLQSVSGLASCKVLNCGSVLCYCEQVALKWLQLWSWCDRGPPKNLSVTIEIMVMDCFFKTLAGWITSAGTASWIEPGRKALPSLSLYELPFWYSSLQKESSITFKSLSSSSSSLSSFSISGRT